MSYSTRYQTAGTSALKTRYEERTLTVYDGGASGGRRARSGRDAHASLVAVVALAIILVAGACVASLADSSSATSLEARMDSAPREVVYVQPGDTLWSIASRQAGAQASTERVVSWIMDANGLSETSLTPGTPLVVPVLAP